VQGRFREPARDTRLMVRAAGTERSLATR